jgi:hypothetical protein
MREEAFLSRWNSLFDDPRLESDHCYAAAPDLGSQRDTVVALAGPMNMPKFFSRAD